MMRFGSFIMGGVVGAAAVMYLSRNKNSMMFSSFTSDSMGKVVNKAMGKMSSKSKPSFSGDGLNEVNDIIKNDSELNEQVEEILQENRGNSYTTQ